jgi:hypothetical protein
MRATTSHTGTRSPNPISSEVAAWIPRRHRNPGQPRGRLDRYPVGHSVTDTQYQLRLSALVVRFGAVL